jgi:Dolichyl-phosphate-mannose-protein mannosyltransferase/LmeA-like phospholipid-binding
VTGRPSERERRRALWAVAVGFTALALVAVVWFSLDRRPPEWDYANHLEGAVRCAHGLARADWDAVLGHSAFYPPLVPCAAGLVYLAVPTDVAAAAVVLVTALGLGMLGTYLLARPVAGETGGAVAALLYGTAPFVVFSMLHFQLDLPLTTMVALMLVVARRADGLRQPGWALLGGVTLGLGMLVKPPFLLYVMPALLWLLRGMRDGRGVLNGLLLLLTGVGIALPWYGPRLFGLPTQVAWRSVSASESVHLDPQTWAALTRYITWFPTQFGVAAAVVFLVGLAVAIAQRRWWLLMSLGGPFLVFELLRNKNLRYTLPLLPVVAVVAALGWRALPRRARLAVAAVLAVVAALQVSATAFDHPRAAAVPGFDLPLGVGSPPVRDDWPLRRILALIAHDSEGRSATVSVVANHPFFSKSNFSYYAVREGLPFEFVRAWDDTPLGIDYMILKTGDVGPAWTEKKIRHVMTRMETEANLARVFPVIGRFTLPDGSQALVRARRLTPVLDVAPAMVAEAAERAFWKWVDKYARDVVGGRVSLSYGADVREGRFTRVELAAAGVTFAEFQRRRAARLRVEDVRMVFDDVVISPFSAVREEQLDLLAVGGLRLERAMIRADDLARFLGELPKMHTQVRLDHGALEVVVSQFGPDLTGRVRVLPAAGVWPFALIAEDVRVGSLALPSALVSWVTRQFDPTGRIARRLVMPVTVGRIAIEPSAVTVSSD